MTHIPTTLFCDIGGVLLTNGWDRYARAKAAETFGFELTEFDSRHQLCFYLYEIGKISLKEYLKETLFYQSRNFTMEQFITFMYAQTEPYDDMIAFVRELKQTYQLKVVFLSNEGRELTEHRLKKFKLCDLADFFVVSSFVNLRKPDREIYRMALDLIQAPPETIVYLDDRKLFIDIALQMGIHAVHHVDLKTTQAILNELFHCRS